MTTFVIVFNLLCCGFLILGLSKLQRLTNKAHERWGSWMQCSFDLLDMMADTNDIELMQRANTRINSAMDPEALAKWKAQFNA